MHQPKNIPKRPETIGSRQQIGRHIAQSPLLGQLLAQSAQSQQLLHLVGPLLSAPLRAAVQAGPLEGAQWCLIAANGAVAAKLRQLTPTLLEALAQSPANGLPLVQQIRIRVRRSAHNL